MDKIVRIIDNNERHLHRSLLSFLINFKLIESFNVIKLIRKKYINQIKTNFEFKKIIAVVTKKNTS